MYSCIFPLTRACYAHDFVEPKLFALRQLDRKYVVMFVDVLTLACIDH